MSDFQPLDPPPEQLLTWILQTGKYIPASTWVITGQGMGLYLQQFRALWKIIKHPERTSLSDVLNLFFHQRGGGMSMLFEQRDVVYDMHVDAAREAAREERAHLAARDVRTSTLRSSLQGMFLDVDQLEADVGADVVTMHNNLQGQDILTMSQAIGPLDQSRLDEPVRISGTEYPRAYVWAYRALSLAQRQGQVPMSLPEWLCQRLDADMVSMLSTMFPRRIFDIVVPPALRAASDDGELDVMLEDNATMSEADLLSAQ